MIPHVKEKYGKKAFFTPEDFISYTRKHGSLDETPAPESVILSYQRSLFEYVAENHSVTPHPGYFKNQLLYLEETGKKVAIAGHFGIGAPAAAVMIEELIAFGAKRFVSLGTAGAISADCPIGGLVLCDGALRDEGVSYHYLPDTDDYVHPDELMTERLAECLSAEGLAFNRGATWTTDAIYRETALEIETFRTKGVKVVEMEAAALFAVARFRGVKICSCFSISDSLADLKWQPEFHSEMTAAGLEHLFRASLKALET